MSENEREETRRERGERTLSRIHSATGDGVVAALKEIAPDFAGMLVDFPFGDVYSRPGLDLRSRQIATIAALVTLGHAERELRWHIRGGLNVGLTRNEITEVITHMAFYAAWWGLLAAWLVAVWCAALYANLPDEMPARAR